MNSRGFFRQLLISHMKIVLVGAISLLFSLVAIFYQTNSISTLSGSLIPISQASSSVLGGVQESLANLRGWVSLDDKRFVRNWQDVWETNITPAAATMNRLGLAMELPGFAKKITELNLLLSELKTSQWWVIEVAQTPGNEPAKVKYLFEAKPILHTINKIIQKILEITLNEPQRVTPKSYDDRNIHTLRTRFYKVQSTLVEIVFQGKVELADNFQIYLKNLQETVIKLRLSTSSQPNLERTLTILSRELTALARVSSQVIVLRNSYSWNIVRQLMETETIPLARRVVKLTNHLHQEMSRLMVEQAALLSKTGKTATIILTIMLLVMVIVAALISKSQTAALARPVTLLSEAAKQLAAGTLKEDIPVIGDDELTALTNSFNTMRKDLMITQQKIVTNERLAAIGRLSGSVAHDIRNPLGVISNSIYFLTMISSNATDTRIKKYISIMEEEIIRANDIISDLMDFSRNNNPLLVVGDLHVVIKKVVTKLKIADNIRVEMNLSPELPRFPFDLGQISRIVINLLTNAIQAMPNGGSVYIVTSYKQTDIEIIIKDEGCGIATENIPKIFEPLFTTKSKGVGLGLSIVKTFIEKHNGSIELKTVVGQGSIFTLKLPL